MNRPPASPLSMSSNDSSFVGRYGNMGGQIGTVTPPSSDVPYTGGPYGAARPLQTSPPSSQHPSSSTDTSRPSASSGPDRPPSSASSVNMSHDGRLPMIRPPPSNRGSAQSTFAPSGEDALQRHYGALRRYLASHLQDEKGNMKPNRARDKLLRLSATQFMELSTDVYDELMRREDERVQRVENVPRFLLPRQSFHPKRNQARQKLSTLPLERFTQLATDVFYELERRIPRFAGEFISRPMSANSNASSRSRATSRGGMRPPPPPYGAPFPPGGPRSRMGPNGPMPPQSPYASSFASQSPGPNGIYDDGGRPSAGGSMSRPLPKTFQSNTIVPNKSTMVEDDDMDEDEDAFGLDGSERNSRGNAEDKEKIQAQEAEISELKEKLESLEEKLTQKESELDEANGLGLGHEEERNQWSNLREELEQKHHDAQSMNDSLQRQLNELALSKSQDYNAEIDALRADKDHLRSQLDAHADEKRQLRADLDTHKSDLAALRAQLDDVPAQQKVLLAELETHLSEKQDLHRQLLQHQGAAPSTEAYERSIEMMQEELALQEKLAHDVREEAAASLREMRELAAHHAADGEADDRLAARVGELEREISAWRARYTKLKAQHKSLRASTTGLGMLSSGTADAGALVRQAQLISPGGLVRDTDVTSFQLSIDELLRAARQANEAILLESLKRVVVCVSALTSAVDTDGYPTPSPSPLSPESRVNGGGAASKHPTSVGKLRARVTGTANSLITAVKLHAASQGLSPVVLVDAAGSNLTAAVVEVIKAARIRPSTKAELVDGEDAIDEMDAYYAEDHHHGNGVAEDLSPGNAEMHFPAPGGGNRIDAKSPPPPAPPPKDDALSPQGRDDAASLNSSSGSSGGGGMKRSNTKKGWFGGWGRKGSVDDEATTPQTPKGGSIGSGGSVRATPVANGVGEGDYDPYR